LLGLVLLPDLLGWLDAPAALLALGPSLALGMSLSLRPSLMCSGPPELSPPWGLMASG